MSGGGSFNTEALGWYCGTLFGLFLLAMALRRLLLWDARSSKLSRAADFVPFVEVLAGVLAWYGISVWLTIMNRFMLGSWLGGQFRSAILMSNVHMGVKWLLATIAVAVRGTGMPVGHSRGPCSTSSQIGALTAIDVCLSNVGLLLTDVTFYTLIKTGTLLWTLMWAVLLGLETFTFRLGVAVSVIITGLVLSSWGESTLSIPGLLCILLASCASGLRWGLTQKLKVEDPAITSLDIIYLIAPSSTLSLLPAAGIDGIRFFMSGMVTSTVLLELAGFAIIGGIAAFFLLLVEVKLIQLTSSLTMGVFGNLKEIVTILIAIVVLGERASWVEWLGLAVAIAGTWVYKGTRADADKGAKKGAGQKGYSHVDSSELALELDALRYAKWDEEDDDYLSDGWDDGKVGR